MTAHAKTRVLNTASAGDLPGARSQFPDVLECAHVCNLWALRSASPASFLVPRPAHMFRADLSMAQSGFAAASFPRPPTLQSSFPALFESSETTAPQGIEALITVPIALELLKVYIILC